MMPALVVDNVRYSYRQTDALSGVSLQVTPGSFVALLGANGAGKTTLFSIISGLYRAHSGTVSIMGHALESDTLKALAAIGVVFQKSTLDMDLTVVQNLRYAADLQGLSRRDSKQRIEESIDLHHLQSYTTRKVSALSGGQRRRVELARALLHRPSLLLLDEPTVGLDLNSREDFVSHVKALCQSQQTGVLWATHLMDEVNLDDHIYLLKNGHIIADGQTADLLNQYSQTSVAALFNEANLKHGAQQQAQHLGGESA